MLASVEDEHRVEGVDETLWISGCTRHDEQQKPVRDQIVRRVVHGQKRGLKRLGVVAEVDEEQRPELRCQSRRRETANPIVRIFVVALDQPYRSDPRCDAILFVAVASLVDSREKGSRSLFESG